MTIKTVVLYWDKNIDINFISENGHYDDYYFVKHDLYKDMIVWLRDNNIWYHNVQRDGRDIHFEVFYMEEESVMAFKLRWM